MISVRNLPLIFLAIFSRKPTQKVRFREYFFTWIYVLCSCGSALIFLGIALVLLIAIPANYLLSVLHIPSPGFEFFNKFTFVSVPFIWLFLLMIYQYSVFFDPNNPNRYRFLGVTRQQAINNIREMLLLLVIHGALGLILSLFGISVSAWVVLGVPIIFSGYQDL